MKTFGAALYFFDTLLMFQVGVLKCLTGLSDVLLVVQVTLWFKN